MGLHRLTVTLPPLTQHGGSMRIDAEMSIRFTCGHANKH